MIYSSTKFIREQSLSHSINWIILRINSFNLRLQQYINITNEIVYKEQTKIFTGMRWSSKN